MTHDVRETEAFDPGRSVQTRDGREVSNFDPISMSGSVDGETKYWFRDGSFRLMPRTEHPLDLVNILAPPQAKDGESDRAQLISDDELDTVLAAGDVQPTDDASYDAAVRQSMRCALQDLVLSRRAASPAREPTGSQGEAVELIERTICANMRPGRTVRDAAVAVAGLYAAPPRDPAPEGGWQAERERCAKLADRAKAECEERAIASRRLQGTTDRTRCLDDQATKLGEIAAAIRALPPPSSPKEQAHGQEDGR